MPWVKKELDVFLRRNVYPKITSHFANVKPLLFMLVGQDKAQLDKLGDPQTGLMFGGRSLMGDSTRQSVAGDEQHEFPYQRAQIDPTETIEYRGDTPTATNFAEDNFGTAAHKWADYWQAFKFGQHSVEMSHNDQLRLESILELTTMQALQRMLERIQNDLWNGTLTESQQKSVRLWQNILGMRHQVDDGTTSGYGTLGQVDRTVEPGLQAKVRAAGTEVSAGGIPDSKVRLDLLRRNKIQYGLTNKFAGAGDFAITSNALFNVLAEEAEARNQRIVEGGVPEIGMEGFTLPMIQYGSTWITYDPDCPEGELYHLTSRSWVLEVREGSNFNLVDGIKEKWNQEEGGGYYNWGQFRAQMRLVCREPHLQMKWTGLTTDGS